MKRALVSVSDKTGLVPFVQQLITLGFEIISTGGTHKLLQENGLKVMGISEITNFPEIMDGRVKTLHPNVHGGLLSVRTDPKHIKDMTDNKIDPIDMVVVNLYPFKQTIEKEGVEFSEAIENIDIGGPSMLRSAAKNHRFVTVLCDSSDYEEVINEIKEHGDTTLDTRSRLAAKVFRHTAAYDATIARYLTDHVGEENPESLTLTYTKKQELRYGENPHQKAAFYAGTKQGYSLAFAEQIQGKELSYNNIQDADAALQIVKEFTEPVVVAIKHKNPCGVGVGRDIFEAWTKAFEADKVSIFGGIIATNQEIDAKTAEAMKAVFLEIIMAPSFTPEALEILSIKKNLRLMTFSLDRKNEDKEMIISVMGGLLAQELDDSREDDYELNVVTEKQPTPEEIKEMLFAMKICKHVKSNAILLAKDSMTVGVGAGQMNRVGSAYIALEQAKKAGITNNIVMASDAFFPFDDVVRLAAQYGVTAIIQPGGSVRDEDSIKACNELGISMIFTGLRHFKH
ncbi:bifunctional phosphoribosylaminoimidazolecarboxamide formyltransferase/IMP cyclohydrolase [Bacteroidales bacterium OttesenSCG-928-B11]|nr:bifunctional phosphoribosylaminoimidazolecarboxamide formyltransferase/IMP cyclohydrolase [Bacteroidales bacterium OttesenSCG-928-C03]MDL2311882.1 bifunctional phosphoribosylaminoimidazolecarboxamide formyltransferase/IMP cyclohydrolase [Bacteroidales bacterium OttesenSCG-928-B11]MDL2326161.1 bifunctional phosphoribosylaminoimidazolecarboxamide formyltransferase/IMP cyclohydrolase [Bacteroidales bacterium OttesenSCG-928-A14]